MELEKFKQSVMHRALKLSKDIDTVTIGPKSVEKDVQTEYMTDSPKDDVKEEIKLNKQKEQDILCVDTDVDDVATRAFKINNCLMEQKRWQAVLEAIKPRLQKMTVAANLNKKELQLRKECIEKEVQAKALLVEHQIWTQVLQEEAQATKRKEQRIDEHKQHMMRVQERNLEIKKAEQEEAAAKEEQQKKLKEKQEYYSKIYHYQISFRDAYQQILDVSKQCRDRNAANAVFTSFVPKMKSLTEALNQLVQQCSVGEINNLDIQTAAAIAQQMKTLQQIHLNEIAKINEQLEMAAAEKLTQQKQLQEQQRIQQQQEQQQEQQKLSQEQQKMQQQPLQMQQGQPQQQQFQMQQGQPQQQQFQMQQGQPQQQQFQMQQGQPQQQNLQMQQSQPQQQQLQVQQSQLQQQQQQHQQQQQQTQSSSSYSSAVVSEFGENESIMFHQKLMQYLHEVQASYSVLLNDEKLKKFKFDCQKAVNTPVNAISPISPSHLEDKLKKLNFLLSGQTVEAGGNHVSAATHPQGVAFCKDLLARKFVYQGEVTVSSKLETAFPIAAVIVSLWVDFPDFGQLLLAHFYNECPYLVPLYPPQLEGQSNEDYYKTLGYQYNENGEVEKQDKFLKRMSGIMRLYAAIMVTPVRQRQRKLHPHGLGKAWQWIACLLNMDPRPDISATLLLEFLEVAGSTMYSYYGKQFQKLLHILCKEYFPKIEKLASTAGSVARLESFLHKVLRENRIPPPVGQLPSNFW